MKNANYRKYNDRSGNSSTYHKKDCTNVRAKLKRDTEEEVSERRVWNDVVCRDCGHWQSARWKKCRNCGSENLGDPK